MNYYDALKLSDGSGYHYVSQNRREGSHPVGYCSRIWPCPKECRSGCAACGGKGYIDKGEEHYKEHVHATAEEACECFRRYLIDGWRKEEYGDWTGCEVCDKPTKSGLTTRPPLGHGYALCAEHATLERLIELTPPVHQITASY